jgi:hypothetical protein
MSTKKEEDEAAKAFASELDRTEYSPAQPDDATRIEDSAESDAVAEPAHVKHDDAGRMRH